MRPKIVIDNLVYRKVMHWVNKSSYEVSGLGKVQIGPDGELRVVDVMLLPQTNGSTHTDIEPEHVNRALYQMRDSDGDLRWWWHSHANMNVFWSGTDMDTIKKIGAGGWFACSVFNQKREVKSAYFGQTGQVLPWGTSPLFLGDLETKVLDYYDPATVNWDKEYTDNVKIQPAFPMMSRYTGGEVIRHERDPETGLWVPVSGENNGGDGRRITTFDPAQTPPETRPIPMPKRVYKAWKKAHREYLDGLPLADLTAEEDIPSGDTIDDWGFDQQEKQLLIVSGWSDEEVLSFINDHDAAPSEILELAEAGIEPQEIRYTMQSQNCTFSEVMRIAFESFPMRNMQ